MLAVGDDGAWWWDSRRYSGVRCVLGAHWVCIGVHWVDSGVQWACRASAAPDAQVPRLPAALPLFPVYLHLEYRLLT